MQALQREGLLTEGRLVCKKISQTAPEICIFIPALAHGTAVNISMTQQLKAQEVPTIIPVVQTGPVVLQVNQA